MTDADTDLFNKVATKKAAAKSSLTVPNATRKVAGVTAETYATLAKAYLDSAGGSTFLVVARPVTIRGEHIRPTVDEWAAWKAYFWSIKKPTMHMDNCGYQTVPCQWPHDFSADWTVVQSAEAGREYRLHLRDVIASSHAPVDREIETAARAMRYRNKSIWQRRRQEMAVHDPVPVKAIAVRTANITEEDLLASAARIKAHLEAKGA